MKNIIWICCFHFSLLYSQSTNWWVFFNDKDCRQEILLSKKSIDRRLKQNIKLDSYDFPVCSEYINILKQHDIIVRHELRWLNAISITINSTALLEELMTYSFVKNIRPVDKMINQNHTALEKNNRINMDYGDTMCLLPYGSSFNQINMLGGCELHNAGFLGDEIIIAVFDAGFVGTETLPIFNNLWDNNRILDRYDFVDGNTDVFVESVHGTMVLSTMGGYMVDSLIGSAPEASYMLFRTEDSSSETLIEEDNWVAAAEYADSAGAHIINSSLGYTILYDDTLNSHTYSDMDGNSTIITMAADLAASRGILVVNSAGNSGNNDWYYIGAPADGDSVLAVGAVNYLGEVAPFSSRGPSYDGRIKPNICAQGVSTVVADMDSTIRLANGTSFSSPIISGLSACLWQANTDLTNIQLIQIIEESSHLFSNPNDSLGYGIPNFSIAYLNSLNLTYPNEIFQIYPNPVKTELVISSILNREHEFHVFNMFGVLVLHKKDEGPIIKFHEFANLEKGLYFLTERSLNKVYPIIKM